MEKLIELLKRPEVRDVIFSALIGLPLARIDPRFKLATDIILIIQETLRQKEVSPDKKENPE